jgi:farnesol dehydrogenase
MERAAFCVFRFSFFLMRVLVTGGSGYLGQAIVRALEARGHAPVVFSRTASRAARPGLDCIDGDITDGAAVRRAAAGCDAICHAAALVALWRPRRADFDDVNVRGLANVIEATRDGGVAKIVYTSTFLVFPAAGGLSPANDYHRTKAAAHDLAARAVADGAPIVCVYPGVVYGPGAATDGNFVGRLLRDHLAGRLPGLIGAWRRWSFAFIDDVAAGHAMAVERASAGESYAFGGENAPQMRLFEIVQELTGRPLPRRIPTAVATVLAAMDEAQARLRGVAPTITRGTVRILDRDWVLDSARAMRHLDYRITPLETGVEKTLAAL